MPEKVFFFLFRSTARDFTLDPAKVRPAKPAIFFRLPSFSFLFFFFGLNDYYVFIPYSVCFSVYVFLSSLCLFEQHNFRLCQPPVCMLITIISFSIHTLNYITILLLKFKLTFFINNPSDRRFFTYIKC